MRLIALADISRLFDTFDMYLLSGRLRTKRYICYASFNRLNLPRFKIAGFGRSDRIEVRRFEEIRHVAKVPEAAAL
jgi:hypothetical protein